MLTLCGLGPGAELAGVRPVLGGSWRHQSSRGGLTRRSVRECLWWWVQEAGCTVAVLHVLGSGSAAGLSPV